MVEAFLRKRAEGRLVSEPGALHIDPSSDQFVRLSALGQTAIIMFLVFADESELATEFARRATLTSQGVSLGVRNARAWAELAKASTPEAVRAAVEFVDIEGTPDPLVTPSPAAQHDNVA